MNLPVVSHIIIIESALVQEMTGLENGEGEDKVESCARQERYGGVEVQLHSFLTSVLDAVSGRLQALVVLPPGKDPPVPD